MTKVYSSGGNGGLTGSELNILNGLSPRHCSAVKGMLAPLVFNIDVN